MQGEMFFKIPFRVDLPFVIDNVIMKGEVGSEGKGDVYITLLASDTEVDYQGDKMDAGVLNKIALDAKEGKITLRRHHSDSFFIAKSVDGEVRYTADGLAQLFITFKAVKLGDTYYPEILHIIDMYNSKGRLPLQASVGGWITNYTTILHKGRPVRVIKDAIVDHVALTPLEGAVNPRTYVREILIKSLLQAIDEYERKEGYQMLGETQNNTSVSSVSWNRDKILQDLEKCNLERRKCAYTRQDIENLKDRVAKYGINPSPVGNIVKPEIYIDVPVEEFADPVNFLFPLRKGYIEAAIDFAKTMSTTFLSIYDTESARTVYTRLVKAAQTLGIPVQFTGSPVDALLPEDVAAKLEGFRSDIYNMMKSWVENLEDYYIKIAAGLWDELLDGEDVEELRKGLLARAEKYGYLPTPTAKVKPHQLFKGWPPSRFADPVGYLFPITPEWVLFSYRAFVNTPVREFYSPEGRKFVYGRILKGLEKIGALIVFDPTFDLNWYFTDSPVFVGVDDYLDDVVEMKKSIEERWFTVATPYVTHSMILWEKEPTRRYTFFKAILDSAEKEKDAELEEFKDILLLTDDETEEPMQKATDATTTIETAPMFPFVIPPTTTLRRKKGTPASTVTVFPHLVTFETGQKKPKELPQETLAMAEIVKKFGLHEVPEIKSKEIKLRWVGPEKLATPVAVFDSKHPDIPSKLEDKTPAVGFHVWGGLQAIRKGEVLAEWIVFSNGSVAMVTYLPLLPTSLPVRLKKDDTPLIDIYEHLKKLLCETFKVKDVFVESVGIATVVWSCMDEPKTEGEFLRSGRMRLYMSPIRLEDGKIVVEAVKVPVMRHYVVEGDENEAEIFTIFVRALRRAGASEEWEKWALQTVEVSPVEEKPQQPEEAPEAVEDEELLPEEVPETADEVTPSWDEDEEEGEKVLSVEDEDETTLAVEEEIEELPTSLDEESRREMFLDEGEEDEGILDWVGDTETDYDDKVFQGLESVVSDEIDVEDRTSLEEKEVVSSNGAGRKRIGSIFSLLRYNPEDKERV